MSNIFDFDKISYYDNYIIIVSGNRMLYQLFLVCVLEKCLESKNKAILIGTPYITNIKDIVTNH